VHGEKRNFYLLTIIDVFSRKIVDQIFQKSIKQIDVINAFRRINNEYGIKGVTIRNDNGSQFIANNVKQYLRTAEAIRSLPTLPHRKKTPTSKPFTPSFSGKLSSATNSQDFMMQNKPYLLTESGITPEDSTQPLK
jgi:transposase InsO family protein